jgi:hypothetical protein
LAQERGHRRGRIEQPVNAVAADQTTVGVAIFWSAGDIDNKRLNLRSQTN